MSIVNKTIDITTIFIKQSSYLIGQHRMKTKEMFKTLKGNAKVLLVSEPLWIIPYTWILTYITLYMQKIGLTKIQIGFVVTISLIAQLIALITGGYFADRWGRKKTVMIFDTLIWIPAWIVLLFANDVISFSIFYFIFGFSWVVAPAWYCLFIEGTKENDRPSLFALLSIIFIGGGVFVPIAGIFIEIFQLVSGFKIMCIIGILSFFIGLLFRWKNLKETEIGNILMIEKSGSSFNQDIKDYLSAFKSIFHKRELLFFLLIQSISWTIGTIMMTYTGIYLVDQNGINLSESSISLFPFIFSTSTILIMLAVIPYVEKEKLEKYLVLGACLSLFGYAMFIFAPKNGIAFVGLSYFLFAAGNAFFRPLSDTYGANIVKDVERAKVNTIFIISYTVFSLPAAPVAGFLYKYSPQLPFILILPLQLSIVFFSLKLSVKK